MTSTVKQKQCTKCLKNKDLDQFTKDGSNKDGLRSKCRSCRSIESKEWQKLNPQRTSITCAKWYKNNPDKVKDRTLRRKYGITIEIFNELLLSQNNVCAICEQPETALDPKTKQPRLLAVDHCHMTGKVRGLLCTGCNAALGFLKENQDRALRLAQYINYHGKT